jgi:cell wall-associated NlpC family hydrolase
VPDGVASIHARIAEIQQRFVMPARGTAAATPDAAGALAFAQMLDAASTLGATTGTGSSGVPVLPGLPGTGTGTAPVTLPAGTGTSGRTQTFVQSALAQAGDPYVWGSTASPTDPNPGAFDCSELVKWAAKRAGVDVPDGSWLQYLHLKQQGATIPVEQALRTPGALLFSFSSEPTAGGGRPSQAHVAISLGDGRTIEARGRSYGVNTFDAGDRFEYGAVIPGLTAA